jgi:succinoglycan biosynthesis protein ExoW
MKIMSHSDLTVVIPFYQRAPEPLVRAINSIKAQHGVERPHVLIVDDESPVSARSILDQHVPDPASFIQLIEQKNKGAAGARNTGHALPGMDPFWILALLNQIIQKFRGIHD